MKRPSRNDDCVKQKAAEEMAPTVMNWAEEDVTHTNYPNALKECVADIKNVLACDLDGYGLCRALEEKGYSPDDDLVEIMGDAFWVLNRCVTTATKEWLACQPQIAPPLESVVTAVDGDPIEGVVAKNYDDGKSLVCIPSKGHVRDGMGTNGAIYAWERLTWSPPETLLKPT